MKISFLTLTFAFLIAIMGCSDKDIQRDGFYFELKKNGSWVNYPRGLVAVESSQNGSYLRSGGFFCFNSDSTEEFSIQVNATEIRYGSDSTAIKPYTKFDVRGVYYAKANNWIVYCGMGDRTGRACIINELKITEETPTTLTGYFFGNLIPADNSFTITEGRFRLPRKILN